MKNSADLLDLQNSSYPTQPHSIIANYLNQFCWLSSPTRLTALFFTSDYGVARSPQSNVLHDLLLTVINANAAVTLLEQRPKKKIQALSGIRTHDLCDADAVLSQLSYQSHMRAVVCRLALYMWTLYLAQV